MSRFHRLQSQNQLHRPERTGVGDPNSLVITDPLDGQYFQDTSTGSVYRYDAGTSNWELLLQYDRVTGRIVNVNQATFTRTNRIGRLTSAITSSPITSVNARLITAVQRGEDIKIVSSADETAIISLTVTADTGSGDVTIPVQSTITDFDFPSNSVIIVEDGLRNVYTSVDPNKLQNRIEVEHTASSIGGLLSDILIGDTGVTSISLIDIDPIVRLADGKRLIITDKSGNSQVVIVDGDQVLSEKQGSVTVQAFDPIWDYEVGRSFLYEPSYEATSRITQTENSILLQTSQISDLSNATASLNISVAENAANITLLSGVTDGINSSISTLEANASAQQATLALLAAVNDAQNSSIAGITIDVSNLEASVNTSVQYDDSGAFIRLLAGPNGSNITIEADQINVDGVVTFINNGTTTIDGDSITTGTIGASQINTESLFAQTISINEGNISFFDAGNEVMRLGEDNSNIGLFIYDVGGAQLSSFKSDGLIIGSDDSDVWNVYSQSWNVSPEFNNYQYVSFDPENGLFVRGQIRADDIISGTLNAGLIVGQEVKSENYTPNVSGFGIFSNGFAEFGNVTVRGTLVTGAGSAIEGVYVSNINAGTITAGTISADRIASNTITADKIDVDDLFATNIVVQSGGSISGSNYTFNDAGGNIAGWIIESDTLKSSASGARIELNKGDNRVSVFDAIGEKAAMGYLEGLPKNDASGNWSSTDYGFWAKNGDRLVIDGDIEYDSGDWLIQNDASYKVLDGSATPKEIIRLGTDTGKKGLFLYDDTVASSSTTDSNIAYTTGNTIAEFTSTGFSVGDTSSNNYIEYEQSNATLTLRGTLNASDIITGTIDAARINTDALFAESVSVTNVISIGDSVNPMQIGEGLTYDGGLEAGDGIKLNDKNYWLYSTSEGDNVFRVGDDNNYVAWTSAGLEVRGTLNASDIISGTINTSSILIESSSSNLIIDEDEITVGTTDNLNRQTKITPDFLRVVYTTGDGNFTSRITGEEVSVGLTTNGTYADYVGMIYEDQDQRLYAISPLNSSIDLFRASPFSNRVQVNDAGSNSINYIFEVTGGGSFTKNVKANAFVAPSNNVGINKSFQFTDQALSTHNVVIEGGIITKWDISI